MTLTELLENKFRADLRFRGETYVKAERVSLIRITPDQVFGIVQDSVEYETQLSRTDAQLKMYCTCEPFQKSGVCKHLWATIVAVQESGVVVGAVRPVTFPPSPPMRNRRSWMSIFGMMMNWTTPAMCSIRPRPLPRTDAAPSTSSRD